MTVEEFTKWLDENVRVPRRHIFFAPGRMLREFQEGDVCWIPTKGTKIEEAIVSEIYEGTTAVPNIDASEYVFVTIESGQRYCIENVHADFQCVDPDKVEARRYANQLKDAMSAYSLAIYRLDQHEKALKRAVVRSMPLKHKIKCFIKRLAKRK